MKKTISTKQAIAIAEKELGYKPTGETIRDWCTKYGIGKKIVGRYRISINRLNLLLNGKTWKSLDDNQEQTNQ